MDWMNVIAPFVTLAAGYVLYLAQTWVKAHTTPAQFSTLAALASQAVAASEELGRANPGVDGAAKYAVAAKVVRQGAKKLGVKLTTEEVAAFINAAVGAHKAPGQYLAGVPNA